MKASIKIGVDNSGLAHAIFYRSGKKAKWEDLTAEEQSNILKSTSQMYGLFSQFSPFNCRTCGNLTKKTDEIEVRFCSKSCCHLFNSENDTDNNNSK